MAAYPRSMAPAFRRPHRITITVPHHAYCALLDRSDLEGRSLSNLASYLLEASLDEQGWVSVADGSG
jgi:hypothetical protein